MTNQEVFDKVATHLITQQERSFKPNYGCFYRGPNGLKCAIGILIPDDKYLAKFDDQSADNANSVCVELVYQAAGLSSEQAQGLGRVLQGLHDNNEPADWPDLLRKVAVRYHLSSACLKASTDCNNLAGDASRA